MPRRASRIRERGAILDDYYRTVQLGLVACFRQSEPSDDAPRPMHKEAGDRRGRFGSDQGLVGVSSTKVMVEFAVQTLATLPGKKTVWAVGERIQSRLADTDLQPGAHFTLPNSISAIRHWSGRYSPNWKSSAKRRISQVYLFHNRPSPGR